MKRLIGIFIFLLICVSSPVYADNKDLVQYIGDSYTQGYSKDGMITGDDLWYVHASQKAGVDYTQASKGGVGFVAESHGQTFDDLLEEGTGRNAKYVVIAGGYNDMKYSYDTIKNRVYDTVKKAQKLYPQAQVLVAMTGDSIETIGGYLMKCEDVKVNTYASTITIGAGTYATQYGHFTDVTGVYHNYYMVDGIVDQSVTGAIEYEGEYYKVDSGKIDTSYNGPWTCGKTTYYLVNGHTNKNMTGIVKYGNDWYFVNNGIVLTGDALIYYNGQWHCIHNGKIDDTYTYQPEILVDAYRSTVLNTVPENMGYLSTLTVNSAISVVNTNAYCRGGGNRSESDQYLATDPFRTDLGKPRTSISRATMRTYSRNAKSQMLSYDQYKNIFYWLYVVEYANFNSQEDYNATLTDEGYRQGGMGASITTMDKWNEYNGYYPLTPCGYGNTLGNRTGLVSLTIPEFTYGADSTVRAAQTMQMARWRGFDNPFGDLWTNLDGIIIDADANNHPNNMNYVYTC